MKSPGRAAGGPGSIVHLEQSEANQGWSISGGGGTPLCTFVALILTEGHISLQVVVKVMWLCV